MEKFRSVYKNFPIGKIINSEPPDFIVENSGICIGIEVTELHSQSYKGEPPRAQEGRKIRALKSVEKACNAKGLLHFQVNVDFHPGRNLERNRESDFVKELTQLIQCNLPNVGAKIHLSLAPESRDQLPEEVISMWIHQPLNSDEQNYVVSSWGGTSPKYTSRELQEEINCKEGRVAAYVQQCHQVWLLIVGGQILPSTWIDLPDRIDEHKFDSSFSKVFFLHDYREQATELVLSHD